MRIVMCELLLLVLIIFFRTIYPLEYKIVPPIVFVALFIYVDSSAWRMDHPTLNSLAHSEVLGILMACLFYIEYIGIRG